MNQATETPTNSNTPSSRQSQSWWLTHYQAWQQSGLTKAAYCRKTKINEKSFYNWSKKFQGADVLQDSSPSIAPFIPVQINTPPAKLCIELSDVTLTINGSPTSKEISEWIRAVRQSL